MPILANIKRFFITDQPQQLDFQQKNVSTGIFGFFNNTSMPRKGEKEQLKAYHGWVYACTNAIAEQVADIGLKLQTKSKTGWEDIQTPTPAMQLLHDVNNFMSFYDLVFNYQAFQELKGIRRCLHGIIIRLMKPYSVVD